jgi:NhaA family Na+:H+ antiporter
MSEREKVLMEGYRDLKHKISGESSQDLRTGLKELGDHVILVYRYCPDLSDNPLGINAARGIVAAEHQGKSEEMYQTVCAQAPDYSEELVFHIARDLKLDMEKFNKDYHSEETLAQINKDIADSKESGLTVFPGLTIDGVPYHGAWDNKSLFNAIRKRGQAQISLTIEQFFHWGASAAAVLLVATLGALLMVNLGFSETYEHWRHTEIGFSFGELKLLLPLEVWINDFLMAIFFLMIGLEIKREVLDGELSDMKRAAMPVIGAVGGMVIPALIYVIINMDTPTSNGWGIPMATDIAFTLGLMALLGKRVPISLKIFISALAVADDLGAIIVIALFYGHGFHIYPFLGALVVIAVMAFLNRRKVFHIPIYVTFGLVLWLLIFKSGLHATLAGVITAILIPTRGGADLTKIAEQTNIIFDREILKLKNERSKHKGMEFSSMQILRNAIERLREPSEYLMYSLEKVVNFFILPLFAFFNTGILMSGMQLDLFAPGNLGILLGLAVGKPLGITGACWIASKMKIASLSSEINWQQLIGASALAGVGFTMSIVVATSAFSGELLTGAKISILIASTVSALIGLAVLKQSIK